VCKVHNSYLIWDQHSHDITWDPCVSTSVCQYLFFKRTLGLISTFSQIWKNLWFGSQF
jgi:hypothetical protein